MIASMPRPVLHRRRLRWRLIAIGLFGAALTPGQSHACQFAMRKQLDAEIETMAQAAFNEATTIVDAEVMSPMRFGDHWKEGLTPTAYLKVHRTWKGKEPPALKLIPVVYLDSCDIALETKGQKVRVLLMGDGVFWAEQFLNGGASFDQSRFNAEIDRMIGHARPKDTAMSPGEETPATKPDDVR